MEVRRNTTDSPAHGCLPWADNLLLLAVYTLVEALIDEADTGAVRRGTRKCEESGDASRDYQFWEWPLFLRKCLLLC